MFKGILVVGLVLLAAACAVYTGCTFRCDKIGAGAKSTGCVGSGARVNTAACVRSGAGAGSADSVRRAGGLSRRLSYDAARAACIRPHCR